ncbi:MAG: 2-C-methyl-D-erythritol 2,4-cyclodiphosphate synthase, partial [Alphaproteobacteria bacterium]
VTQEVILAVLAALDTHEAAAPGLPVTDALWHVEEGFVTGTAERSGLWRAQTPQGFRYSAILAAHRALAPDEAAAMADDVAVARAAGLAVAVVPGDERNIKITRPEDFARAEALMGAAMDVRVGNGFDVHRFGPGDHVRLCGVSVPHDRGLIGHSDADVALHAVTDAVLGALALGDIGSHFPPSDPQWKGADSAIFLTRAVELAREQGYTVSAIDVTIICELPKIGPHVLDMRARVAAIAGIEEGRISVKATTTERLGFAGRGEGIAALATATLVAA